MLLGKTPNVLFVQPGVRTRTHACVQVADALVRLSRQRLDEASATRAARETAVADRLEAERREAARLDEIQNSQAVGVVMALMGGLRLWGMGTPAEQAEVEALHEQERQWQAEDRSKAMKDVYGKALTAEQLAALPAKDKEKREKKRPKYEKTLEKLKETRQKALRKDYDKLKAEGGH
jgi:hypothetical protein